MTNIIKSVSIPLEMWLAFEEKHPTKKFSHWVQEQIEREIKTRKNKRLVPEFPRCKNNPRYEGIKITRSMCTVCGVAECDDRLD